MAKALKIPDLNLEQTIDISLKKILSVRFNEMISYEEGTLKGEDIEALHAMRVLSRRIQAILKTFREAFPTKNFKEEYSRIRTLKNALGEVRNHDVFIERLEKFAASSSHNDKRSLNLLIAKQKVQREQKRRLLLKTINYMNRTHHKDNFIKFTDFLE